MQRICNRASKQTSLFKFQKAPQICCKYNYSTTYDANEVAKFARIAKEWWDPKGELRTLHQMNPTRMNFIRRCILSYTDHLPLSTSVVEPLKGLKILDVGCGGGILSESLARLGANVTGVDASSENIAVAYLHLQQEKHIRDRVQYLHGTPETLVLEQQETYDAVMASEVIEHVADVELFVQSCAQLLKPGGTIVFSTINRTPRSYALAIVAAEYLLRLVPKGTHDWNRFITPEELTLVAEKNGLKIEEAAGIFYNPLLESFSLTKDLAVNYIMSASKKSSKL